ncbi:HNH endonuclease [Paenarthrobacter sp. NPDC089988]|uniref:HNH endonuclease n=1 Tax=Paenarthrobacter sp. NPDC089988 TaxID=3364378 RepID=UPI00380E0AEF
MAAPKEERSKCEKWRHPSIKDALHEETDYKCAYCEAKIVDVSFPHVEHILPKAAFPQLAHSWSNLTTACGICNNRKGDFYEESAPILNPYTDDLPTFIRHRGPLIDWAAGNVRGEISIRKLDLNRPPLLVSRAERMNNVRDLYDRWHASTEPLRSTLAAAIRIDAVQGEFQQTVIAYLRELNFHI